MKRPLALVIAFTTAITLAAAQLIPTSAPMPTAAELAAKAITDTINEEIGHRVKIHQLCFDTVWRNERDGATPAAVLAALGTHAKLVFLFASENLADIDNCAKLVGKTRADFIADSDCVPPLAFTIQADGTVTLN
jgi:hypothetical protein